MVKDTLFEVVWACIEKREDTYVGRVSKIEGAGSRGRGRPGRRWKNVVEYDMSVWVEEGDDNGYGTWRGCIHGLASPR